MAVDTSRLGVLYCPRQIFGGRGRKHREKLEALLSERGVEYDIVQSESTESVERLVRMLINNGYKTIVIVGGDSALNDAVNCLMHINREERESISIGVIPNGVLNDFAKFWGLREGDIETSVDAIVNHRVRTVDLGCIRYVDKRGENCHRYFLNCVNVGLIADIMNLRRQTRSLLGSRTLSFVVSALLMLFHRMEYKMSVKINSDKIERKLMNVCIGSGPGYGQTPNAVPYNGLLDVTVVSHPEITQLFHGLWLLFTGRFLNHKNVRPYRTGKVEFESAAHAMIGIDGRMLGSAKGSFTITVVQEVVNFLISKC